MFFEEKKADDCSINEHIQSVTRIFQCAERRQLRDLTYPFSSVDEEKCFTIDLLSKVNRHFFNLHTEKERK